MPKWEETAEIKPKTQIIEYFVAFEEGTNRATFWWLAMYCVALVWLITAFFGTISGRW